MGADYHQRSEKSVRDLARQRVLAALSCVNSLAQPSLVRTTGNDQGNSTIAER
jgi:hypothetical protein